MWDCLLTANCLTQELPAEYFLRRVCEIGIDLAADELGIPNDIACAFMDELIVHFSQPPGQVSRAERAWELYREHPEWMIDHVGGKYYVTSIAIDEHVQLHAHAPDPITAILATAGEEGKDDENLCSDLVAE